MRAYGKFVLSTLVAGFLVVAPIYLAALLLLKALKSLIGLVQPIAKLLPAWLPAELALFSKKGAKACFCIAHGTNSVVQF